MSLAPLPENLADKMPGFPFNTSTHNPESSAMAGKFDAFEANLALVSAFSMNVHKVLLLAQYLV